MGIPISDHPLRWTCPACDRIVFTSFCPRCGEAPLTAHHLTLRGLAAKLVHAMTSIDARVVRTVRCLVFRPGALTVAWTHGIRKPYVQPFQLFLIANVVFIAVQWATQSSIFGSPLQSHLNDQDWNELSRRIVDRRLAASGATFDTFERSFDAAVKVNAKSWVVLMTMPFAMVLPLVFWRARRPLMSHVVFSMHFYTLILIVLCIALAMGRISAAVGWGGIERPWVDDVLSGAIVTACAAYLYLSIGPVYGGSKPRRIASAVLLAAATGGIVLAYRFLLFVVTVHSL